MSAQTLGGEPYASADWAGRMLAALPRGDAWSKSPDSLLGAVVLAMADGFARLDARAQALLAEADPRGTVVLLADWERNYGLPDPCAGPAPDIVTRQLALNARTNFLGGQSNAFFVALAASYGYAITVTKHAVTDVSTGDCASPINDDRWAFALQINAPAVTVNYADVGLSDCTDPLASWGNTILECVIANAAHAYADLIFAYS